MTLRYRLLPLSFRSPGFAPALPSFTVFLLHCGLISASREGTVLLELRVENYAVIDNVAVGFGPGLNLLTGETGAGKSILIDALALLLGEKSSSEMVRHGADRAVVSAIFDAGTAAASVLDTNGIDC